MTTDTLSAIDETPHEIVAARQALLAVLPRLKQDSDSAKAVSVLTFEPMKMHDIVKKGGLKGTCFDFLNRCADHGLIDRPEKAWFRLKAGELPAQRSDEEQLPDSTEFIYERDLR